MSVFIIPPLIYYNMLDEFYKLIEPTIMKVEKMLNVKRTRSKKSKYTIFIDLTFIGREGGEGGGGGIH